MARQELQTAYALVLLLPLLQTDEIVRVDQYAYLYMLFVRLIN